MTTEPQTPQPGRADVSRVVERLESLESLIQTRGLFELPIEEDSSKSGNTEWQPQHHWRTDGQLVEDQWIVVLVEMAYRETAAQSAEKGEGGEPSESGVRVKVDGTFVVIYRLKPGPSLTDEEVREFAAQNGAFNVRPFWREFLHNSLLRTGPNAALAPLMKLSASREPIDGQAGSGATAIPPTALP